MAVLKIRPIDNIKVWYKFWSIRLGVVGSAIVSLFVMIPDAAIGMWNFMPETFKNFIPPQYMPMVGVFLFVLGMVARLVKQRRLPDDTRTPLAQIRDAREDEKLAIQDAIKSGAARELAQGEPHA
ncbi:MAG: hypothetical protein JWR85_4194 [Marmoricola sp.]|nr:hypothetical protein [Marmoricola sp.]